MIGPYNSGCAEQMLPVLNRAGIALVSPTNSEPYLVDHPPPELYPAGRHGYARIWPSDDYTTAAGALAVKRFGDRVFFLEDAEFSAGNSVRGWFAHSARKLGLTIAGQGDASASRRTTTGASPAACARPAPSVVYLDTNSSANLRRLLLDLRAALDPSVAVRDRLRT